MHKCTAASIEREHIVANEFLIMHNIEHQMVMAATSANSKMSQEYIFVTMRSITVIIAHEPVSDCMRLYNRKFDEGCRSSSVRRRGYLEARMSISCP